MSNLFSLLGWTFLPNLVTGWVQSIYYGVTVRAGDPRPQPGTPRFAEHRRRIHMLVVGAYLLYTIYEADHELARAGNYYGDLGLQPDATDREIKTRFRRLAALHHPDKAGAGGSSSSANDYYVHLKHASDTLLDPARRFAYERFGPDAAAWQHVTTPRDFVGRGVQQLVPYYAAAAAFMYLLGLLGYLAWGRCWRWLLLAALVLFELHAVTRPAFPWPLVHLLNPLLGAVTSHPPYLPFQAVALARKLSVTVYIAFSQIGPLLGARAGAGAGAAARPDASEAALRQGLDRLEQAARAVDADAVRLMEMEMAPFAGDGEAVASMRVKVKEWLVQNTIRADPMVRDALGRSFRKRRIDAPAGAAGNRSRAGTPMT